MAEDLLISLGNKEEKYLSLIPQIHSLISGEKNLIANLANIAAALKEQFGWLWVGFYIIEGDELVLGPFQGPVACTRIPKGKGVCGHAWQTNQAIVVPDVEAFPGHIACSSLSKSEIVLPIYKNQTIWGIMDVDSTELNSFDELDLHFLSDILAMIKF
jgi:GAF domain-containing protein